MTAQNTNNDMMGGGGGGSTEPSACHLALSREVIADISFTSLLKIYCG